MQWISVLKSLTAYQMYRQHVQARVRRAEALHFLLLDDQFPRSVYRCVMLADESLRELPRHESSRNALAQLKKRVRSGNVGEMAESNTALHQFIDELQIELGRIHVEIESTYFRVEALTSAATQSQSQSQSAATA